MSEFQNEYRPDFVSHPGETLLETLEVLGMSQAELALRTGRPKKTINEIIKGKASITPETALQLELVLGFPASFWNERERHYQEALARIEQNKQLSQWTEWLKQIPYGELAKRGWVPNVSDTVERIKSALSFFGVVSPEQWEIIWGERINTAYRQSQAYSADAAATAAWLRKAEILGYGLDCASYDETRFRQVLQPIRSLTQETPKGSLYERDLVELCQAAGVAVALVPRLPKSRVFGASQWLSPRKALIAISLYYKTDDQFWFSFFHEAGHLLLHSKKDVFIDVEPDKMSYDSTTRIETEANRFAGDLLIPPTKLLDFIQSRPLTSTDEPFFDEVDICSFAAELGIAPSIVVGRLQHDGVLDHKYKNDLKTQLDWSDNGQIVVKRRAKIC